MTYTHSYIAVDMCTHMHTHNTYRHMLMCAHTHIKENGIRNNIAVDNC